MRVRVNGAFGTVEANQKDPNNPRFVAFRALCAQFGEKLAASKSTLIMGSTRTSTAGYHVLQGFKRQAAKTPDIELEVRLYRSEGAQYDPLELPDNIRLQNFQYPIESGAHPPHQRLGARTASIIDADGAVIIGGHGGAAVTATLATATATPIIGLPQFDGIGAEVFHRIKYSLTPTQRAGLAIALDSPQNIDTAASAAFSFLASQSAPKTAVSPGYFISYAHSNAESADHIEVLLRRAHRTVLRDENASLVGKSIDRSLKELILQANVFVALCSQNYLNSEYCMGELEFACHIRDTVDKSVRVCILMLDDASPLRSLGALMLKADDRTHRELAVRKLIESEP
ncbi:MAG: toll/interleukin-1 receptor domain-containing protein [Myxococcota bacterium]